MPPLSDQVTIELFREALREWSCDGFVVWKDVPRMWLARNFEGCSQKRIARLMHEHIERGGVIDQQPETREVHRDKHRFHFDFRLDVDGRMMYIETTLDRTATGPVVTVVSFHDV
jgi:hypothetical protein